MQTDFEKMFERADDHYLQAPEMIVFKHNLGVLKQRLDIYKSLRNNEIPLFQSVADRLVEDFPETNPSILERSLKHWISTLRYCAMAMLLNNPEYFQHRILEWLGGTLKAYEQDAIEQRLFQLLREQITLLFSTEQLRLLDPFLEQAQTNLLISAIERSAKPVMIGEIA